MASPTGAAATAIPNRGPSSKSWFGKPKERLVWRSEFETLEQARKEIADYIDRYHQRPHSGLGYRTPTEVRRTREDGQRLQKTAA
jgi:putative transposase